MKIYLASSWRNIHQPTVLAVLRAAGHEVYDFRNPSPGSTGFGWRQVLDRPIVTCADQLEALAHPRAQEGFDNDFHAMKWADACVLLLPCGNSAHLEAGWFAGKGKPVAVLVPELREPELMYKCFDVPVRQTPLFETVEQVLEHLDGLPTVAIRFAEDPAKWHDGAGWYYTIDEYEDEGCVGAFASAESARDHARASGYVAAMPLES